MNLERSYPRAACALCVLAITSYATATAYTFDPAFLIIFLGLPLVVAAWWLSARKHVVLPRWAVNGMLAIAVLYAAARAVKGVNVEAVAEMVVLIQVVKIGDRRGPRDDAQILSLAIFLAIAAMLTSNQLGVGVQLAAFVPLLIGTVMLYQLHAGWVSAGRGPLPPGRPGHFHRTVTFASLATLILSLFVFIIMPRGVGENVLGAWRRPDSGSRTAFVDHVQLGSSGIISESSRIVLNLLVREATGDDEETPGANLGSPDAVYYLRGAVLKPSQKTPGSWVSSPEAERGSNPRDEGTDILVLPRARAPIRQDISIRGIDAEKVPLFASWRPVKIRVPSDATARYSIDRSTGTIRRSGQAGSLEYTVWSSLVERAPADPATRTPVSHPSRAIQALAETILRADGSEPDPALRDVEDDVRAARVIQDYLRRNYSYTLVDRGAEPGVDPVEQFLFSTRAGHCEYFAAAMVSLCRSVGINARMVAGYIAAEFNTSTGRYTVRESNAHAWVESEAGAGRWWRFDPSPPAELSRIHKPKGDLWARMQQMLESVEYAWNAGIVGFDENTRQSLLGPGAERRTGVLGAVDVFARKIQNAGPRTFVRALLAGIGVFVGVASLGLLLQWAARGLIPVLRRWLGRAGTEAASAERPRFYAGLLRELERRGIAKPAWRPPLAHAQAIRGAHPPLAEALERLSRLYYRAAFGGRPLSRDEMAQAERQVRSLRANGAG